MKRMLCVAALASACMSPLAVEPGYKSDSTNRCVWSFDCDSDQVCSDEGACIAAPQACFDFTPEEHGVANAPAIPQTAENPEVSEADRDAFRTTMVGGLSSVSISEPAAHGFRELTFPESRPAEAEVLYDSLQTEWGRHREHRELLDSAAGDNASGATAIYNRLSHYQAIHRAKTEVRQALPGIRTSLTALEADDKRIADSTSQRCDQVLKQALANHDYETRFGSAMRECLNTYEAVLMQLDQAMSVDVEQSAAHSALSPIPSRQLWDTLRQLRAYAASTGDSFDTAFPSCSQTARAREFGFAVSLYAHQALSSLQKSADLFPFTDLDVWQAAIGVRPLGLTPLTERNAVDLYRKALVAQNEYLVRMVDEPATAVELSLVTVQAPEFLERHPRYRPIAAALLAEAASGFNTTVALLVGGACLVGTVNAAAQAIWVGGPWALLGAASAGVACGIVALILGFDALRTYRLYRSAMTFRYFASESPLATQDRVDELQWSTRFKISMVLLEAVGVLGDVVVVGGRLAAWIRVGSEAKATRGLTGVRTSHATDAPSLQSKASSLPESVRGYGAEVLRRFPDDVATNATRLEGLRRVAIYMGFYNLPRSLDRWFTSFLGKVTRDGGVPRWSAGDDAIEWTLEHGGAVGNIRFAAPVWAGRNIQDFQLGTMRIESSGVGDSNFVMTIDQVADGWEVAVTWYRSFNSRRIAEDAPEAVRALLPQTPTNAVQRFRFDNAGNLVGQ